MRRYFTNNLKKKYNLYGFIKIKNFFLPTDVKKIKKNLFLFLKKEKKKYNKKNLHFANNTDLINSVHNLKWPYIKKIQSNKEILFIAQLLLGDKLKNFGAEVFAKPAKVGMRVPIHQDNFYWNIKDGKGLTIWIALDKSTKKNGAIFYYKGSHKFGVFVHKPSYAPGSSQVLKNINLLKRFQKKIPTLEPGDILIHHCLVLHGSNKNLSNQSRTGLTIRYISKSSKIDKKAKKKYEISLKKQMISRKKI